MIANYLNVLGGLLALAVGAFALTYEILHWHADAAEDRRLDDLARPGRHARKVDLWSSPTVPNLLAAPWPSPPSSSAGWTRFDPPRRKT
jgi:hypothetical protein